MAIENPMDLFRMLLSNVRQSAENGTTIFNMMSENVENSDIKEALQARAFVSSKVLNTLDECFKIIGEHPVKPTGRLHDVFLEDFRRELGEIKSQEARHLYILAKAHQLNQLRIGEYVVLIEAADMTGHYALGVLLSSCLADKLAFVDRTRQLIKTVIEGKIAARKSM